MNKTRGELDIIYDLTFLIYTNITKDTVLQKKANMNQKTIDRYKIEMVKKGLIILNEDNKIITEKGIQYIKGYQTLKGLIKDNPFEVI